MPRRILAAVAGFLILTILTSVNAQSGRPTAGKQKRRTMNLSAAVQFIRPSVVQIVVELNSPPAPGGFPARPSRPVPLGTGFLVNEDGYVATALHVVRAFENLQGQGQKRLLVGTALPNLENYKGLSIRGSFQLTECDIIDEDARHDLALLKLKQNPFKGELGTFANIRGEKIGSEHKAATLSPGRPLDGEAIAVSGYPLSNTVLITTSGNLASAWGYDVADVHVPGRPEWFRFPDVADSYLADVQVNGGNSGGPVYSVENGKVIGVCVAFANAPVVYSDGDHEPASAGNRPLSYNSGLSVVVPIRYVIDMLKKKNLKWQEAAH